MSNEHKGNYQSVDIRLKNVQEGIGMHSSTSRICDYMPLIMVTNKTYL